MAISRTVKGFFLSLKMSLGLRAKMILLASFLLVLPLLGYQYIVEMESFLRQGQEQTLVGTTRAVATALHERPTLFNAQASFLNRVEDGKDLYAYELQKPITIDGNLADWQADLSKSLVYDKQHAVYRQHDDANIPDPNPISFRQMVGTRGEYLYGYLQVTDKFPTFRATGSRFLDKNDHLIIALSSPQNSLQRYIISVQKSGWFNAYNLTDKNNNDLPLQREKRIHGYWQQTETGYNIEFRLPVAMLGDKLGFALHTTSSTTAPSSVSNIESIIATSNTNNLAQLGTILVPSPEIDKILNGLSHTQSRLWVVDRHQRVLATAGDIHQAQGVWGSDQNSNKSTWWQHIENTLLKPVYGLFFNKPNSNFVDELAGLTQLDSDFINQALSGQSQSSWRLTSDHQAMILSAASPIFVGDKVMGMVVAEETTNGIRTLRNQALTKLFNVLIAVIVIATLVLFLFTANIATRVRKLRDQAEQAIDEQGRISAALTPSTSKDEIGDLSRSLAEMVDRLGEYHRYLEKLPSRLSHELGTPVAVVCSSLENLAMQPQDEESKKYIERSQTGILRLNRILTNMSEATRLEQSLQSGENITLCLNELLNGCVQGYQMTYSEQTFIFNSASKNNININADPDFMVQCLDKLINNAVEFNTPPDAINIRLSCEQKIALIEVENSGPVLPADMSDELLNSMVSVRAKNTPDKTHLGLGLFIAKMICDYHHGSININNNQDNSGVIVSLRFPLI
ncbi:proteobacterial dedicated sortase system histidine kinase [Psychromonas marina]|uniref:histidine kinase n=1 Tax=Psychromonas marina TaxID=88364 RepID=A0ABQ6DY25_9GAMM|nr:proteobacterial dedicated sortase system histidine kinase [Psychromonas marina]GLS90066.1 proteobacterial dedicated sortase system histidine kinase [Psychromonas marina]